MRLVVAVTFATLLVACSGSNRVEDIVPAWANTPPPGPSPQYTARKQERAKPPAAPQEAKKPEAQSPSEE
jgi:hypothetical protein